MGLSSTLPVRDGPLPEFKIALFNNFKFSHFLFTWKSSATHITNLDHRKLVDSREASALSLKLSNQGEGKPIGFSSISQLYLTIADPVCDV